MFISQTELEKLIDEHEYTYFYRLAKNGDICLEGSPWAYKTITIKELFCRLSWLEDYLGIHYEEKTTKGYVKNKRVSKKK